MTNDLILHIGDCKTGSTSIQQTLRTQNWQGATKTIAFPILGLHHSKLATMLNQSAPPRQIRQHVNKIKQIMEEAPADISIISSEHFEFTDPKALKKVLETHFPEKMENLRLISYIRPHADRVLSSFAEQVKLGKARGTMEEQHALMLKRKRYFYFDRLNAWRDAFGDRLEVRPMIRDTLYSQCVVHDFLSFVLQDTGFSLKSNLPSNESSSLEDLALLQEFHKQVYAGETQVAPSIGRNLARIAATLPAQKRTKLAMHKSAAIQMRADYLGDAQKTDAAFFTGTPLQDALDKAVERAIDAPQSLQAEDHFPETELRTIRVMSRFIKSMHAYAPDQWSKHFTSVRLLEEADHVE